ncbi:MAG: hypothetical protein QOI66_1085 [Myxococcales bacterium]|jgi:hypothetical protein|nr:hypothetical protein [Myxococcales bacterium]
MGFCLWGIVLKINKAPGVRRFLVAGLLLVAAGCSSPHADISPDGATDRPIAVDQAGKADAPAETNDVPQDFAVAGDTAAIDTEPPADGTPVPAVAITTAGPLMRATVGVKYATTITASGGVPPYTFALPGLPAGLSWLSIDGAGTLGGTPSQAIASPVNLTVTVHDSRSDTATASTAMRTFALSVGACAEGTQVDCAGTLAGGMACGFGKSTCTAGVPAACVATTPSTDTSRCGAACGACDANTAKTCAGGVCQCGGASACAGGATCCGSGATAGCFDTTTNIDNCGGCGVKCPAGGYHCDRGCKCGAGGVCGAGETCCGSGAGATCIALGQSMGNCGACGMVCDATRSNACSGGACKCGAAAQCAAGQTCCGGSCFDLAHDVDHCLGCGSTCDRNKADNCLNGCRCGNNAACGNGQTCCGGACVDTSTNTNHCGGCGKVCPGGTNACLTGTCSCGSHVGACGAGTTCCTDNCYNLTTSASSFNCKTCGHSCLGDACSNGACQPTPVSGAAAAPYNFPASNSGGITVGGHTYTFNYAIAPDGKQDPAIFKDSAPPAPPLCIWATYSAGNEEVAFQGMTADANFIYGLLNGGPEGLFKCPLAGGPGVTLFESPAGYARNGLVDTGTALYWEVFNGTTEQVYRLVK